MRFFFILLTVIFLSSCATTQQASELEQGKRTFHSGDYKNAFHQLLPIALSGNADAQYAVGYMYYYGYGVSADADTGLAWIKKSAVQGNALAMKAMKELQSIR